MLKPKCLNSSRIGKNWKSVAEKPQFSGGPIRFGAQDIIFTSFPCHFHSHSRCAEKSTFDLANFQIVSRVGGFTWFNYKPLEDCELPWVFHGFPNLPIESWLATSLSTSFYRHPTPSAPHVGRCGPWEKQETRAHQEREKRHVFSLKFPPKKKEQQSCLTSSNAVFLENLFVFIEDLQEPFPKGWRPATPEISANFLKPSPSMTPST